MVDFRFRGLHSPLITMTSFLRYSKITFCDGMNVSLLVKQPKLSSVSRFRSRIQACQIHSSSVHMRKSKKEISSEPLKFTTSPANIRTLRSESDDQDVNEYQPLIVSASLLVFFFYFFYFREENDLDELMSQPLFDRVPNLEEPHLRQAIPRMKQQGQDTSEAEARLKELIQNRKELESQLKVNKN